MRFHFIELTNGQVVETMFEAGENSQQKTTFTGFDFKSLTNGKISKKIAFVDENGDQIKLFM